MSACTRDRDPLLSRDEEGPVCMFESLTWVSRKRDTLGSPKVVFGFVYGSLEDLIGTGLWDLVTVITPGKYVDPKTW